MEELKLPAPRFTFRTKKEADEFIKRIKDCIYKYDVVTVNDVLKFADKTPRVEYYTEGLHYGYCKANIAKVKPEKVESFYLVSLPIPGRMVRGPHGYWTTEEVDQE